MTSKEIQDNKNDLGASDRMPFDSSVIIELLEKKLLSIVDKKELGILAIKYTQTHPLLDIQKVELTKFIQAIENELHRFLKENSIADNLYKAKKENDIHGNILNMNITIQNLKLYNKFIEQLDSNQLLRVRKPLEN